ncbi:MAG TPA: sugar phosphate isomerase/epimerase family protein [Thermoanaerobaculia bacterium]|nr:sugar phosphate isomerase/epimerase family protein [Thermoanaerobaculia bacterium]
MSPPSNRREFLRMSAGAAAGLRLSAAAPALAGGACAAGGEAPGGSGEEPAAAGEPEATEGTAPLFRISLAQWSLHRTMFGELPARWSSFGEALANDPDAVLQGSLDPLELAATARSFGIDGIEYVNTFFFGHAQDRDYLAEMKRRAEGEGVQSLLIMCDAEGDLGDPDEAARADAIERHVKWLEAAQFLGCHSIRVNARSRGEFEEQQKLAADGLRRLCERAEPFGVNVLVENHGELSSNGQWLAGVMELVDHSLVGTLPDFGNFLLTREPETWYDRYQGVEELMPYAKAVSAKSHVFGADGEELRTDYERIMRIVLDAGYRGWVGIEYEGDELSEMEGIEKTRDLLIRVRERLAPSYLP